MKWFNWVSRFIYKNLLFSPERKIFLSPFLGDLLKIFLDTTWYNKSSRFYCSSPPPRKTGLLQVFYNRYNIDLNYECFAVNFCHLFEEGLLQTLWTFKMFMCNWSLMCSMFFFIFHNCAFLNVAFAHQIIFCLLTCHIIYTLLLFTCISYQFNTDCLAFYIINVHLFWLVINVTWKIG